MVCAKGLIYEIQTSRRRHFLQRYSAKETTGQLATRGSLKHASAVLLDWLLAASSHFRKAISNRTAFKGWVDAKAVGRSSVVKAANYSRASQSAPCRCHTAPKVRCRVALHYGH
uniref:Transposase n=1 Tax=Panagrellus redivivus TaxID=6233 RepID=A0A7E4VDI3_PANRE